MPRLGTSGDHLRALLLAGALATIASLPAAAVTPAAAYAAHEGFVDLIEDAARVLAPARLPRPRHLETVEDTLMRTVGWSRPGCQRSSPE